MYFDKLSDVRSNQKQLKYTTVGSSSLQTSAVAQGKLTNQGIHHAEGPQ